MYVCCDIRCPDSLRTGISQVYGADAVASAGLRDRSWMGRGLGLSGLGDYCDCCRTGMARWDAYGFVNGLVGG